MNGAPLCKRRKPGPQPAAPTHEELFREVYMAALGGLCSQFEVGLPYHKPQNAKARPSLSAPGNSACGLGISPLIPSACFPKRGKSQNLTPTSPPEVQKMNGWDFDGQRKSIASWSGAPASA